MHIDSVSGLVKMSAIVVSSVGVAVASFFDSAATSIGIAAAGIIIGLSVVMLLGAAFASFRRGQHAVANAPVEVGGTVMGKLEPFAGGELNVWEGVFGWRLASAFLEPPVPGNCEAFKGYMGTGPGDSAQP